MSQLRDLTYDIKLVRLQLVAPDEIHFLPGQYVQVQNQPYDRVEQSVSRAYSISSSNQNTQEIDLMIRLVSEGVVTTWVHQHLKEGDPVTFTGPMGDFCLHEGDSDIIMVAGGSGMAPMVSLLHELVRIQSQRKITYFFGAVSKKDLFYMNEMREFKKSLTGFTFVPTLAESEPEDAWDGETGLITMPVENHLKTTDNAKTQAYLCGSPGMINACVNLLSQHGITKERIYFDPFA